MDEPQHHEVGRDAQEHVDELQAQVPNDNSRHVLATLIHCLLTDCGVVKKRHHSRIRRHQPEEPRSWTGAYLSTELPLCPELSLSHCHTLTLQTPQPSSSLHPHMY